LARDESDAFLDRIEAGFSEPGFGVWAVEEISTGAFIGFAGLLYQSSRRPSPRPSRSATGSPGMPGARATPPRPRREAVRFGFERAGLVEIVSMTTVGNIRSRAVMDKLGMTHDSDDDFDHPRVPDGHPLKRHVLYRLTIERWHALHTAGCAKPRRGDADAAAAEWGTAVPAS
jgi:RimJ/RimL family protein N-acetyltransferase